MAGFGLAVVLGVIAVWLISTSTTPKSLQLGVLAGLWGAILGAFTAFGSRRHHEDSEPAPVDHGAELALRSAGEVDRAEEAAARRAYEARLEHMLRREINATMTREVASLRSEIAQLRQDLLEKVGGQLRLERIETTRLIGSDLEALQHEVRQLKQASTTGSLEIALGRLAGADLNKSHSVVEADVHTVERVDAAVRPVQRAEAVAPEPPAQRPVEVREPIAPPPPPPPPAQPAPQQPAARQPAAQQPAAQQSDAQRPAAPVQPAMSRLSPPAATRAPRLPEKPPAATAEDGPNPVRPPQRPETPAAAAPPRGTPPPPAPPRRVSRPQQPTAQGTPPPAAPAAPPASLPTPPPPPPPIPVVAARDEDPFASLPRIRPFTDFELDPIEPTPAPVERELPEPAAEGPRYTGRRRRADEIEAERAAQAQAEKDAEAAAARAAEEAAQAERDAGRHSRGGDDATTGRRHRRAEENDSGDDLLARLLAREGVQR